MSTPDDAQLTDHANTLTDGGKVLMLACGALAREILALIRLNGWDHVTLHCLPAILHARPERIAPAVEAALAERAAGFDNVFVVYADCGTGGDLQRLCDRLGVQMVPGPHCYAFFDGLQAFADRDEVTAFYLTDFLTRQFDAFVWQTLGLDRHPELLPEYFGNYDRLVYLAQTDDAALRDKARECAARLGLRFEHRFTGYGDLAGVLEDTANSTG